MKTKIYVLIAAVLFLGSCSSRLVTPQFDQADQLFTTAPVTHALLDALGLDGIYNLMIVAHPDDETIWGGRFIIEDYYFVVCLTSGFTPQEQLERPTEFRNAMNLTKSGKALMLGNLERDVFAVGSAPASTPDPDKLAVMKQDIATIIGYKNWNVILTHGPSGESGHNHHVRTHEIVTEIVAGLNRKYALYYFIYNPIATGETFESQVLRLNRGTGPFVQFHSHATQTNPTMSAETYYRMLEILEQFTTQGGAIQAFIAGYPFQEKISANMALNNSD